MPSLKRSTILTITAFVVCKCRYRYVPLRQPASRRRFARRCSAAYSACRIASRLARANWDMSHATTDAHRIAIGRRARRGLRRAGTHFLFPICLLPRCRAIGRNVRTILKSKSVC